MRKQLLQTTNFRLNEFLIDGITPNEEVRRKIYYYFMLPLERIRKVYGKPIKVSKRSSYRPLQWELSHGRSGGSEHVFRGRGACDIICDSVLLDIIFKSGEFGRIIYYPEKGFCHCDYVYHIEYDTVMYFMAKDNETLIFNKGFNF